MRVTLARAVYLFNPSVLVFVSKVMPKVSIATVVYGVLPSFAGQVPPFSQDHQKVAAGGGEKAHGASNGTGHCVTSIQHESE